MLLSQPSAQSNEVRDAWMAWGASFPLLQELCTVPGMESTEFVTVASMPDFLTLHTLACHDLAYASS